MNKKIAIITGASGGIGKEFTKLMLLEDVGEIWAIARNQEKLDALRSEFGEKIIVFSKDLTKPAELTDIGKKLEDEKPVIAYLINNAGVGRMGSYQDFSVEEIENTVSIHCSTVAILCSLCIPYMRKGSRILNISSASSFQPLPYLNLYSAAKAFERHYTRALNAELKSTGITATAVCPGWVDTDFLAKAANGKPVQFPALTTADKVAAKALKDAKKGKDMSVDKLRVKFEHLLAKIFSQKAVMRTWVRRIKKYVKTEDMK